MYVLRMFNISTTTTYMIEKALFTATGLTPKEFINHAIEGGWKKAYANGGPKTTTKLDSSDLLDPLCWQAVGKSMRWENVPQREEWLERMHRFIDCLVEDATM